VERLEIVTSPQASSLSPIVSAIGVIACEYTVCGVVVSGRRFGNRNKTQIDSLVRRDKIGVG
jgi:hypothetical protein